MHVLAYLKTGPGANHAGGWRQLVLCDIAAAGRSEQIASVMVGRFVAG